jgi:hypothetical protein
MIGQSFVNPAYLIYVAFRLNHDLMSQLLSSLGFRSFSKDLFQVWPAIYPRTKVLDFKLETLNLGDKETYPDSSPQEV